MRKFFLSAIAALFMSANAMAIETTTYVKATDKTAINNAINAEIGAGNTHIVVLCNELDEFGNEKTVGDATSKANLGTTPKLPSAGKLVIRSNQTDINNLPLLELEMGANPVDPSVGYPSIVFENVALDQRTPLTGAGYIISNKNADNYYGMDEVIFRNCDIKAGRAIYREENTSPEGSYTPHHIKKFIFENNKAHQCDILSGNGWRPFYFVAIPDELYINGNMFYDMPYAKEFITFHKTAVADGTATKWYIYNNTIMMSATSLDGGATQSKAFTFVNASSFLDPNTTIDIYNNLFLGQEKGLYAVPTDVAEGAVFVPMEATEIETETGVTKTGASMVYAVDADRAPICYVTMRNNLMSKYYQDPERGSEMDLYENLDPETYSFSFDNCFKPEVSNFIQLKEGNALYTAGASAILDINDEPVFDIPTVVGAPMMYVDDFPQEAKLQVNIEGTYNGEITYTIAPEKEVYQKGDEVTITLNDHNSYYRTFNEFKGWSGDAQGTEKTISITLEEAREYNVTATYAKAMDVVAAFDFSTITKNGSVAEYVADLGDQMGTAKIFAMVADTTGIGGAIADRKIQTAAVPYIAGNFQTRPAKFGEDPAEQQMPIISRRTASNVRDFNRDYAVLQFSTTGIKNVEIEAFVGTDNNASKNQKVYYSLDNETYTEIADAAVALENGKWSLVKATLPADAENQEAVYVKFQGEVTGGDNADNCAYTTAEGAFDPTNFYGYDVFEYMGNILVTAAAFDKSALEAAIQAANDAVNTFTSDKAIADLSAAIAVAEDVKDNATSQEEIDDATATLKTATTNAILTDKIDAMTALDCGDGDVVKTTSLDEAKAYFAEGWLLTGDFNEPANAITKKGTINPVDDSTISAANQSGITIKNNGPKMFYVKVKWAKNAKFYVCTDKDMERAMTVKIFGTTESKTTEKVAKNTSAVLEFDLDATQETVFEISADGDMDLYAVKFLGDKTPVEVVESSETTTFTGKYIENGNIVIVKDGVKYNAVGIQK